MQAEFLEVRDSHNRGRGLYAKKDISADTVILQVEASQFITYSMFAEHPFLASLLNKTEHKIVEFAYFAAFTYHQHQLRPSTSPIYQYLQRTPTLYHNLITWTHKQLQELGNTDLMFKIKKKQEKIKAAFSQIHKMAEEECRRYQLLSQQKNNQGCNSKRGSRHMIARLSPQRQPKSINYAQVIKRITLSDVIKYISMVESRNAYFPNEYDSVSEVGALVPHLDLFNHSTQSKCRVELADRTYKVIAVEKINRGEEVCVDYGPFSREDFLQFYGMVPEEVEKQNQDGIDEVQNTGETRDEIEFAEKSRKDLSRRYRMSFRSEPSCKKYQVSRILSEAN